MAPISKNQQPMEGNNQLLEYDKVDLLIYGNKLKDLKKLQICEARFANQQQEFLKQFNLILIVFRLNDFNSTKETVDFLKNIFYENGKFQKVIQTNTNPIPIIILGLKPQDG